MRPLTARQQEVLELLKRHLETTGMPPTRAEISRELGFKSPNAAEEHLKALARKGAIEIVAGASRGIRIIDDSANDEEEVTVKRLERKGSVIYLHAENEEFKPIVVNLEEQPHFEIEGIAVGIIRNNAWM